MREEEKKRSTKKSSMKRFLSKRWALPAIYLACAAILLTAVLWFQGSNNNTVNPGNENVGDVNTGKINDPEAIEVGGKVENIDMPVSNKADLVVKGEFYDKNGSEESQEKSLIFYDNQYHMNRGIDLAMKDGKTFEVIAALSGKVTKVQEYALLGNVIEVTHSKGITTYYQSVNDIAVEVGDTIVKGQPLAKAGQSLLNEKAGIHVHFEIRKDGVAVNPKDYFEKSVVTLQEAKEVTGYTEDEEIEQDDNETESETKKPASDDVIEE